MRPGRCQEAVWELVTDKVVQYQTVKLPVAPGAEPRECGLEGQFPFPHEAMQWREGGWGRFLMPLLDSSYDARTKKWMVDFYRGQ